MPPKRPGTPPKNTRNVFTDWNLDKDSSFTKAIAKPENLMKDLVEEANFDNWERSTAVRVSERFKDKVN